MPNKTFNNKFFQLQLYARRDLHYGQWLTHVVCFHNRGVKFLIGKFFKKRVFFPNILSSFKCEILFIRWAIGIDFIKWKK